MLVGPFLWVILQHSSNIDDHRMVLTLSELLSFGLSFNMGDYFTFIDCGNRDMGAIWRKIRKAKYEMSFWGYQLEGLTASQGEMWYINCDTCTRNSECSGSHEKVFDDCCFIMLKWCIVGYKLHLFKKVGIIDIVVYCRLRHSPESVCVSLSVRRRSLALSLRMPNLNKTCRDGSLQWHASPSKRQGHVVVRVLLQIKSKAKCFDMYVYFEYSDISFKAERTLTKDMCLKPFTAASTQAKLPHVRKVLVI